MTVFEGQLWWSLFAMGLDKWLILGPSFSYETVTIPSMKLLSSLSLQFIHSWSHPSLLGFCLPQLSFYCQYLILCLVLLLAWPEKVGKRNFLHLLIWLPWPVTFNIYLSLPDREINIQWNSCNCSIQILTLAPNSFVFLGLLEIFHLAIHPLPSLHHLNTSAPAALEYRMWISLCSQVSTC